MRPTQPPVQWVPGVKWLGRGADHLPPSSAEVKKEYSYTSTPLRAFGSVRGTFTLEVSSVTIRLFQDFE
jgi:hypothetical protein